MLKMGEKGNFGPKINIYELFSKSVFLHGLHVRDASTHLSNHGYRTIQRYKSSVEQLFLYNIHTTSAETYLFRRKVIREYPISTRVVYVDKEYSI